MRILLACLTLCAGPAAAGCDSFLDHAFMTVGKGDIRPVYLSPVEADSARLTYTACQVVTTGTGDEVTDCHVGVTERTGAALSFTPLGTCSAENGWSIECPDFTAEGFTHANRTAIEGLITAEGLSCRDALRPQPIGTPEAGHETAFEIMSACGAFDGVAQQICESLPAPAGPVLGLKTGDRLTLCSVGEGHQLIACRSN